MGLWGGVLCLDSGVFIFKGLIGFAQIRAFPIFVEQWNPFSPLPELSCCGNGGAVLGEAEDGVEPGPISLSIPSFHACPPHPLGQPLRHILRTQVSMEWSENHWIR